MDTFKWVITAISKLTGDRVEITGAMPTKEAAEERMQRHLENTKHQRFKTYTRLRVEHRQPIQLTIKFEDE